VRPAPVVISRTKPVVVTRIPPKRVVVLVRGVPYYYVNGTYYLQNKSKGTYQKVVPPIGTIVPSLPEGSILKQIEDNTYFEYQSILYKQIVVDGVVKYKVVSIN
jgi:hypothetical protein